MNWRDRIVCNPDILLGKPTAKGTRISVELVLRGFASGWRMEDILESYPHLAREDVLVALAGAAEILHARRFAPLPELGEETIALGEPSAASPDSDVVMLARSARESFPSNDKAPLRDEFDPMRSEWDQRNPEK